MKKCLLSSLVMATVLLVGNLAAAASTYTFTLDPADGDIAGERGSAIGWGYSITNESSTYWLDTLAVNAGIFQFATLDSGDYFNFPLIAPGTTVTESFAPAMGLGFGTGLAALTWDNQAPSGFTNEGDFVLSTCWADLSGNCIQSAPDAFAPYSVTVSQSPEPSSNAMIRIAIVALSFVLIAKLARRKPSASCPIRSLSS